MEPINAQFAVIKVDENTFDVVIIGEDAVLKSFIKVYDKLFYVENSVFDNKPAIIAPDFPNAQHAETWKQYWATTFADPDNACDTCPTVHQLLGLIEEARKKS